MGNKKGVETRVFGERETLSGRDRETLSGLPCGRRRKVSLQEPTLRRCAKRNPKASAERRRNPKALAGGKPTPKAPAASPTDLSRLPLEEKIARISEWLAAFEPKNPKIMLYLVMYDIEDNRIRTNIAKYLVRNGCLRIQKSVYLAKTTRVVYQDIHRTLREINEMYENHDSIFLLPVPEEKFRHIKVIGKNVEFEVVTGSTNLLFL